MRAYVLKHYGGLEGLQLMDVPAPSLGRGRAIFSLKYALPV